VNGYLLDTNAALIGLADPDRLTDAVRNAILTGPNILSVAVYWEVLLKSMKGKLDVGDPLQWWKDALKQLAATPLPLRPEHIAEIYDMPPIHQDPFDRVLIAQASLEDLLLVTTDQQIPRYVSDRFRVIV
jgi:PIN domain nuclease of toxin-antitoxin system